MPLDVAEGDEAAGALFAMEDDLAGVNVAHGVDAKSRDGVAAAFVDFAARAVTGGAIGDDVAQEAGGTERVELEDIVGGAFAARRVEDGAGEVDVEEEEVTRSVRAEVETRVAFAFE